MDTADAWMVFFAIISVLLAMSGVGEFMVVVIIMDILMLLWVWAHHSHYKLVARLFAETDARGVTPRRGLPLAGGPVANQAPASYAMDRGGRGRPRDSFDLSIIIVDAHSRLVKDPRQLQISGIVECREKWTLRNVRDKVYQLVYDTKGAGYGVVFMYHSTLGGFVQICDEDKEFDLKASQFQPVLFAGLFNIGVGLPPMDHRKQTYGVKPGAVYGMQVRGVVADSRGQPSFRTLGTVDVPGSTILFDLRVVPQFLQLDLPANYRFAIKTLNQKFYPVVREMEMQMLAVEIGPIIYVTGPDPTESNGVNDLGELPPAYVPEEGQFSYQPEEPSTDIQYGGEDASPPVPPPPGADDGLPSYDSVAPGGPTY